MDMMTGALLKLKHFSVLRSDYLHKVQRDAITEKQIIGMKYSNETSVCKFSLGIWDDYASKDNLTI